MSLHLKSLLEDKWLLSASYNSANYAWHTGRISETQWSAYLFIWIWGSPHFANDFAGWARDNYYNRHGLAALRRREARAQKWITTAKKLASKE